jgi:glucan phosphoethanolaminetransferase (alkaline phosphatase superfamily)
MTGPAAVESPGALDVRLRTRGCVQFLVVVACGLIVLSVVATVSGYGFHVRGGGRVRRMFQLNDEGNVPTWFSAMLLVLVAVLLAVIALRERQRHGSWMRHWMVLAGIFVLLSMVEITTLREDLIGRIKDETEFVRAAAWVTPAAVLCLVLVFAYRRFVRDLPRELRRRTLLAGAIYVGSAMGMELVSSFFDDNRLIYHLLTDVEESGEMFGLIVFIGALLEHLRGTTLSVLADR